MCSVNNTPSQDFMYIRLDENKEEEEKDKEEKDEEGGRHPSCQNLMPNMKGVSLLMSHLSLASL